MSWWHEPALAVGTKLYTHPPQRTEPLALVHEMTPEMMRKVQMHSELGAYAAEHLVGAYDLFSEFWSVAISAMPQKQDLSQRTEQNFCSRCGKRTNDIHTCTPPKPLFETTKEDQHDKN
jgi:hypothetical protein